MTITFSTSIHVDETHIQLTVALTYPLLGFERHSFVTFNIPRNSVNKIPIDNFISKVNPYFTFDQIDPIYKFELRNEKLFFSVKQSEVFLEFELTEEQKVNTYSSFKDISALLSKL